MGCRAAKLMTGPMFRAFLRSMPESALLFDVDRMVRDAVQYYSEQWYPYPYPHITSIEGPIEGMEYPMITFDPRAPSREERKEFAVPAGTRGPPGPVAITTWRALRRSSAA